VEGYSSSDKTSDKRWIDSIYEKYWRRETPSRSSRAQSAAARGRAQRQVVGGGDGPRFGVHCTRPLDTTTYKGRKGEGGMDERNEVG
jgi:hypothetical protein